MPKSFQNQLKSVLKLIHYYEINYKPMLKCVYRIMKINVENKFDLYKFSKNCICFTLCYKFTIDYCSKTGIIHNCDDNCHHIPACALCTFDIYQLQGLPYTCKIWDSERNVFLPNSLGVRKKVKDNSRSIAQKKRRKREKKLKEKREIECK